MNRFQHLRGFLLFHWRVVAAVVALLVVGVMITFGLPAFPRFGGQPSPSVNQSNGAGNEDTSAAGLIGSNDGLNIDGLKNDGLNNDKGDESGFERNQRIMKSTDPEVLISELLRVSNQGLNEVNNAMLLVLSGQRAQIASRLLELELTQTQRRLAVESLIESMLVKIMVGSESGKRFEALEEEFSELTEMLTQDEDPAIASRVAMLWIIRDFMFFNETPNAENFEKLNRSLDEHFDSMQGRPKSVEPVTRILLLAKQINFDQQSIEDMLQRYLKKMESIESEELKPLVDGFRVTLVFDRFKLNDIAERLLDLQPDVDADVDQMFDTLREFGNAPEAVYQLALDAIGQYRRRSRPERADELIQRYQNEVLPKIDNLDLRERIQEILNKLK